MIDAKVVHRDLTADNILVVRKEGEKDEEEAKTGFTLKVMDFGVCGHDKLIPEGYGARGSMRYYSPESANDKLLYTEASDVFSFGLLIYELLHGEKIWPELKKVGEVLARHEEGERPKIRDEMPEGVRKVIESAWRGKASERWSFRELAGGLRSVVSLK